MASRRRQWAIAGIATARAEEAGRKPHVMHVCHNIPPNMLKMSVGKVEETLEKELAAIKFGNCKVPGTDEYWPDDFNALLANRTVTFQYAGKHSPVELSRYLERARELITSGRTNEVPLEHLGWMTRPTPHTLLKSAATKEGVLAK